MRAEHTARYLLSLLLPAVLIYGVFFILPTLAGLMLSFFDWTMFSKKLEFIAFQNYLYLMREQHFMAAFRNTIVFAGGTTLAKTLLGFFLALLVNGHLFGKSLFRTIYYLPAVLSNIIVGIAFTSVLKYDGMLNRLLAFVGTGGFVIDWLGDTRLALFSCMLVETWKWSGLSMAIFIAGLQTVPHEFYEAASIDGVSRLQRLAKITVPLLMPAFSINVTLGIVGGLKVFDIIYIMTGGGPGHATQVINTMVIDTYSIGLYGRSNAMGIVLIAFIAVIALFVNSFLSKREVEL